jgi:hypothetical protein
MTTKEKAQELVDKFQHPLSEKSDTDCLHIEVAKEFALIAVDEILDVISTIYDYDYEVLHPYYIEIKQEIEKI